MKAFESDALWRDVAEVILTANDPEVLLRATIRAIALPFDVSFCVACEPSDSGDFHFICHSGFADGEFTTLMRSELAEQLLALSSSGRTSGTTQGRIAALAALGCRAFICEPTPVGTENSGAIIIGSRTRDEFAARELDELHAVARCIGMALQRLRALVHLSGHDRRKDEIL